MQLEKRDVHLLRTFSRDAHPAYRGDKMRAKRLMKAGLLKDTGLSVMHGTVFALTDAGREILRLTET